MQVRARVSDKAVPPGQRVPGQVLLEGVCRLRAIQMAVRTGFGHSDQMVTDMALLAGQTGIISITEASRHTIAVGLLRDRTG